MVLDLFLQFVWHIEHSFCTYEDSLEILSLSNSKGGFCNVSNSLQTPDEFVKKFLYFQIGVVR